MHAHMLRKIKKNCFLILLTHFFLYKTDNNRNCYMEMVATNNKSECAVSTQNEDDGIQPVEN